MSTSAASKRRSSRDVSLSDLSLVSAKWMPNGETIKQSVRQRKPMRLRSNSTVPRTLAFPIVGPLLTPTRALPLRRRRRSSPPSPSFLRKSLQNPEECFRSNALLRRTFSTEARNFYHLACLVGIFHPFRGFFALSAVAVLPRATGQSGIQIHSVKLKPASIPKVLDGENLKETRSLTVDDDDDSRSARPIATVSRNTRWTGSHGIVVVRC